MPRTRSEVDRDSKVGQILDAAETRLLAGGYEAMSLAAMARDLGLAQNTLYWYFGSKDELLVAVLLRLLGRLGATKPPPRQGITRQVLWGADYLAEFAPLRATVRERASVSAAVAAFEKELSETLHRMLRHVLEPYVPSRNLDVAASALMATVEGTFVAGLSATKRRRVIKFTLGQMTTGNGATSSTRRS